MSLPHMTCQVVRTGKTLFTQRTTVAQSFRHILVHAGHVCLQLRVAKSLVTNRTGMLFGSTFLVRMRVRQMIDELIGRCKAFATIAANMRGIAAFSLMQFTHVLRQVCQLSKKPATELAAEWLSPTVNVKMAG
jgi:hypothetical protein